MLTLLSWLQLPRYRYCTVIPRFYPNFLLDAKEHIWEHEDVVDREPLLRFVLAVTINVSFLSAKERDWFRYHQFGSSSIIVNGSQQTIAASFLITDMYTRISKKFFGKLWNLSILDIAYLIFFIHIIARCSLNSTVLCRHHRVTYNLNLLTLQFPIYIL